MKRRLRLLGIGALFTVTSSSCGFHTGAIQPSQDGGGGLGGAAGAGGGAAGATGAGGSSATGAGGSTATGAGGATATTGAGGALAGTGSGGAGAATGCSPNGPQCNNCIDDDGDGLIDAADPECIGPL